MVMARPASSNWRRLWLARSGNTQSLRLDSGQTVSGMRSLASRNLRQLLEAGLAATINSDDPAYFGGYLNENFTQTFAATQLTALHAYTLARNSFEASFIDAAAKRRHIDRLDERFDAFSA